MGWVLTTMAYGLGVLATTAAVLFLFGCVMCAWTDDEFRSDRAPVWARGIGWATTLTLVVFVVGLFVRPLA